MKARNPSTGTLDTVYVKALDSMPVGTEVDFVGNVADVPAGWEQVDYTLFESSSGASSGITLSDSIANYNAVEIFYHSSDNVYGNTGKIYSPSGRAISLVAPFNIDTTIYNKQARISITGTTATISDQRETAMSGGGVTVNSGTYFYINKIVGYK